MRTTRTTEELSVIQEELAGCAEAIGRIVEMMEAVGMEEIVVHSQTILNHRLPELTDWAHKMEAAAKSQTQTFKRGVQSKAEYERDRYKRQRLKAEAEKKAAKKSK